MRENRCPSFWKSSRGLLSGTGCSQKITVRGHPLLFRSGVSELQKDLLMGPFHWGVPARSPFPSVLMGPRPSKVRPTAPSRLMRLDRR
uniref:Uncharacterized protein n=1 Tax=Steinernema glaseri TaxID=37863 RepID=A0A1I7YZ37_9BILA